MIERYSIKQIDNEEALCIYLNYSYEFGLFYKGEDFSNMKEKIKNYIINMRIKFKGTKILLLVGGIGIATILLTPTDIEDIKLGQANYTSSSIVEKIASMNSYDNQIINSEDNAIENENNDIIVNQIPNYEINENINIEPPTTEEITSKDEIKYEEPKHEEIKIEQETIPKEQHKDETITEVVPQNLVTIYRSNGSILNIPFEEYIVGVVAAEMPASFPIEALKAQAVVARTYAKQRISKGLKLTDSVSTQSYKDEGELRSMWGSSYDDYYSKIKSAVDSTNGLSIYYNGNYIDAVYHSTSNGYTEDAEYVWGNSVAYLKSVASPWDTSATTYLRTEEKSNQFLLDTLGLTISEDTNIEIISRDGSGRVTQVRIGDSIYEGVTLRNILGLRSTDFDLEIKDGNLVVTTRGYGHGVGMSQYGAAGMARDGYSFVDILVHYYTGVSIY